MLFNTLEFLIFFTVVTSIYYLLPQKYRWIHLLLSSCIFYMSFIPVYILILFVTIIIDYLAGIWIAQSTGKTKKFYLILSIFTTCLVLFIFKYFDFFDQNLEYLLKFFDIPYSSKVHSIILPIGLSFHTFQSLSYVIEVYHGRQKAERHFGIYSLYVMFYPQLVTGPIERPQNLLVQLREHKVFKSWNIISGLRLILFGLFVKMVIADNLASYVDLVYKNPSSYNGKSIATALFFYSFQIYGDFFGYSTIAIGTARVMGFNLIDNFKNPYSAKSISEFWQRWHISLSTWFRDYLYFPLGGNKKGIQKWFLNILIVFTVSGLWHGANWTFVLWGLAHGFLYIFESVYILNGKIISQFTSTFTKKLITQFFILKNFVLVSLIWILFRADSLYKAKLIFQNLLYSAQGSQSLDIKPSVWIFLILFIVFDRMLLDSRFDIWCSRRNDWQRLIVYITLIFCILVFSSVEEFPFIYFQF